MQINIENTALTDVEIIFALYEDAIAYQKEVGNNHWLGFEPALIAQEIDEHRHYKICADNNIVGTFCITFSDPVIWQDSSDVAAIYIHRIATSHLFRGYNVLGHIVNWAKVFAKTNKLFSIRMDTGGGNNRLINYYIKNGFTFIGETSITYAPELPAHYHGGTFALLEIVV